MLQTLSLYLAYPFVRYALIVGVLIALCSSLLGVTLVLKRFSFIGDGLSHVAFGAIAVASILNLSNNMLLVLPVTILCAVLSVIVVAVFILFYNKIFAITFDESFARATGSPASTYNLLIAVTIAVIIVLAMNLVGSLLISALVIFPALSAMRLFKSFRSVTICSAVISIFCSSTGLLISILAGTPVGSTIVAIDLAAFLLCSLLEIFRR